MSLPQMKGHAMIDNFMGVELSKTWGSRDLDGTELTTV